MKRSAVAFIVIGLGVATLAQTPPPAGQTPPPVIQTPPPVIDQPPPPQFRASIELVRLDVSVLDKKRRPVRGLSPTDFTVLENGVEQAIAAFTPVELPDAAPDPTGAPWLKTVASDVGGNADMQQRRLLILAIDDATIENDVKAIKSVKEIAHSVVKRLGPTDLMSVVFTRDNRGSQDFTSDRARLDRAIDSFTIGSRGMGGGPGSPGAQMDELWFLYSVGMMDRAVDFLADVPDRRKAIIYVGQGLPFSLETAATPINANIDRARNLDSAGDLATQQMQMRVRDQMTDVFERANRANVNVYTVDPCGLRVAGSTPPPSGNARNNITPSPPPCQPGLEIDYLVQMAAATGGRPIVNTNDFGPGLDAAFAENASYYLLGYQSTDQARDGKFRKLEVRVNRPDLEVRTRTGYDAPREESLTRPKPQVSPLGKAMSGVVPRGDFPMQITAAPFAIAEKGMPPSTVAIVVGFKQPIRESLERTVENVDLQITAYDSDGRSYGTSRSRADVAIRAGATGSAEYEVFGRINLKPGRYQLRVAAFLASFDTAGSVYFDVDVPDFSAQPLSMSGLLVSAMPSPVYAPKDGLKTIVPVIPTTRRVFAPTYKVSAFMRLYQGGKTKLADVAAHFTIRDTEDKVLVDKPLAVSAGNLVGHGADLQFDVPVADLPSGHYLLTVEAGSGATAVRRDSRFQIVK